MILNQNANTHPMNQPNHRARKKPEKKPPLDSRIQNFHCTLEEKCAWMRAKQEQRRKSS